MEPESINFIKELEKVFSPLAQKIGETSQFGWDAVYRQQIMYGWVMMIISLLSFISALGFAWYLKWLLSKGGSKELKGFVIISLCVFTLAFIFFLGQGILHIINPSFYAIEYFLSLISP